MSDDAADVPPDPKLAGLFTLHVLLGIVGSLLTGAAVTVIHNADWRAFAGLAGIAVTNGAIVLAKGYMSPRQRAIMELHDPTPAPRTSPPPLPPAAALLPLLLLPALALSGCTGFGQCLLGKLKSSAQVIISDVSIALASSDWESQIAQLGVEAGGDFIDCTVKAIVASRETKRDAKLAAASTRGALPVDFVLEHGKAWLAKHPAHACAEPRSPAFTCTESPGIREVTCRDAAGNEVDFQGTLRLASVSR